MTSASNPQLTRSDRIVLENLATEKSEHLDDHAAATLLASLNDDGSPDFEPVVFTNWDLQHLRPRLPRVLDDWLLQPYLTWAQTVVRRKTDVVFLTHILLYLATAVPSAVYLFFRFSWPHAIAHWLVIGYYCGPFTLLLHNHIHNNGVLAARYALLDRVWPYVLEPLMGHTWDSYYYHHVKHHHVENNGPDDLSSTIRYQRDSAIDFAIYVGRFLLLIWIELPCYFLRKHKPDLALRAAFGELVSYAAIYGLATVNFRATMFVLVIPLLQMRVGMMVGNWGQHAFVDHEDPQSDFRSSITVIDVAVCLILVFYSSSKSI